MAKSLDRLWRVFRARLYPRGMGIARKGTRMLPVRRSAVLETFEGQWVAVKGDRVLVHGPSAVDVVLKLRELGDEGSGAVLQRVATPQEALAVGLG